MSSSLGGIFATAILPIVAIAVVGFVLGRRKQVDVGPLNTVTVYVLVPALVFHSLATTTLGGGALLRIGVGVLAFTLVMTVLAEGVGRLSGEAEPVLGTMVITSVFSNAGNYGIPVAAFAFGAVGRATAVAYIVAQSVFMYTIGVYAAARGEAGRWQDGVKTVVTVPLLYAVVGAGIVRWLGVVPPTDSAAMETLKLVGDSAIPVMLLILGAELAGTQYRSALGRVAPASTLKMVVAPGVAVGLAIVLGFQNSAVAAVFVLECAMPTAVTTLILTGEFAGAGRHDGLTASEFASTTIFVTTVVSVPILTVLIAVLQSGILG